MPATCRSRTQSIIFTKSYSFLTGSLVCQCAYLDPHSLAVVVVVALVVVAIVSYYLHAVRQLGHLL